MRRSDIPERQRSLIDIRGELCKNMLLFLKDHPQEVFTVGEILDWLGLGPDNFRHSSPRFSAQIYCADYDDVLYCAAQAATFLASDPFMDVTETEIAGRQYYGIK